MSSPDAAPYERLARMIERELQLVGAGRMDEFAAAVEARTAYVAELPSPAPETALPVLERARVLHARVEIETLRVREQLQISRASRRRARRVAKGYSGPMVQRYSTTA